MTLPGGPSQLNPDNEFGITGTDGSVPSQATNTQDAVMSMLKGRQKSSTGWKKSTADVYSGLRRGSPGNPVSLPLGIVEGVVSRWLAPFGLDDEFDTVTDALNKFVLNVAAPMQYLSNAIEFLKSITTQHNSELANLRAQIAALRQSTTPTTTPDGGWDPCNDASGFAAALLGTLTPTGWGALTASTTTVAHYGTSPSLDRNRVGMLVKAKTVGQTGLHFCSDDAMTNYCRLLLNVTGTGRDTVSLVTGTGPNEGIDPQTEFQMRIPTDSFWEIAYEPYDENSDTSNTVHVFMGGKEIVPLRWPDQGNLLLHGADHLRWGVMLNGLDHPTRRGFAVTDVSYGNWLTGAPQ